MSPPIYTPDGSEVSEIVLPDGSTASQVIDPDGNVVFEAGPDIPDSGIWHYDFEEGSGSSVTDRWTDKGTTDASFVGGPTWDSSTVKWGTYALTFDGTDDGLVQDSDPADDPEALSFWIHADNTLDGSGDVQSMFGNQSGGYGIRQDTGNFQGEGNSPIGVIGDPQDTATVVDPNQSFAADTWHHVVFNWNGSYYDIWVNNSQQSVQSGDGGHSPKLPQEALSIGYRTSKTDLWWSGTMDSPKSFNKQLSSSEIDSLYNSGSI